MISIAISSIFIAGIFGYAAYRIAQLKYRESAELGVVKGEVEALRKELGRINPKEIHERLVTLENRSGVRIF